MMIVRNGLFPIMSSLVEKVREGKLISFDPKEPSRVNVLFQHIQEILSSETDVIAKTGDSWFNCLWDVGMRATTFIEPFLLIEYKWNGIDEGKVCPFASERIHELDGKVYDLKKKEVPLLPLQEELEDEIAKSGGGSLAPQDNATLFMETKVLPPKSSEISATSNVGTPAVPPPNAALTSTGVATSTITNDSVQNTPQG
ncbi:hypothetical protein RHMOL_Rhmol01G0104100 [Rhododendron molle]|uniref:Uncharacterized protein n=1 Tax=Rhododendron molle TaxID=49168 RepID=A0ACC0Q092_RHOML|nr:hypothetical protein RHMOL_Rhmol01G0104100 [Rhododendron molle]